MRKGRLLWIALVGLLVYFTAPKALDLEFPQSSDLQLFEDDHHPMERYCCTKGQYGERFNDANEDGAFFRAIFVWGIKPKDAGNPFDPDDKGEVEYRNLDLYSTDSQQYLHDFCEDARSSSWYTTTPSESSDNCLMQNMISYMSQSCSTSGRSTCCGYNSTDFPFDPSVMESCVQYATRKTSSYTPDVSAAGVWFDTIDFSTKAFVLEMESNIQYSEVYKDSRSFDNKLSKWLKQELNKAPSDPGIAKTFFISEFDFYSLQDAIGTGAIESAALATIVAIGVLLLMTAFNVTITLIAGAVITSVVMTLTGILVLDGWELSVINSVIFSCAIGLAIDFVAHISHAFGEAIQRRIPMSAGSEEEEVNNEDHEALVESTYMSSCEAAEEAIRIMGPSITMAAISTGIAGAVMLLSVTLFFYSYGQFLCLVMALSWLFSMFLLAPILAITGPLGRWGSLSLMCRRMLVACGVASPRNLSGDNTEGFEEGAWCKNDPDLVGGEESTTLESRGMQDSSPNTGSNSSLASELTRNQVLDPEVSESDAGPSPREKLLRL